MEVKENFKQTELGIIPKDWNVKSFAEIFTFLSTANNSRSDLSEGGDIKYIHYGDIHTKWKTFLDCNTQAIPCISASKLKNASMLEDGDLVVADASEDYEGLGIAIEMKNVSHRKVVAGLHTFLLRANKQVLADGYKGYLMSIAVVKDAIIKSSTGISVYSISKSNLKKVLIPFPPSLNEQQTIAKSLFDTDSLITKLEELIAKKQNVKQATMQQLLTGKRRLEGFKEKWEAKKLSELLDFEQPTAYLVKDYQVQGQIPVLTANKTFILGYTNQNTNVYTNFPAIIFDDFTTLSKYVPFDFKVRSSAIKILKNKKGISNLKFMHERMQLIYFPLGDHKRHYISEYSQLQINIPNIKEQNAIAEVLDDMNSEIEHLEDKLSKFRLIKHGMMQTLLTGKIRLV